MIEEPSPSIWPRNVSTAPSHGLYLAEVFYHPQDLEIPLNELEVEEKEQNKENVYNGIKHMNIFFLKNHTNIISIANLVIFMIFQMKVWTTWIH